METEAFSEISKGTKKVLSGLLHPAKTEQVSTVFPKYEFEGTDERTDRPGRVTGQTAQTNNDRPTDGHTNRARQTETDPETQTDRQAGRQTDRQIDTDR